MERRRACLKYDRLGWEERFSAKEPERRKGISSPLAIFPDNPFGDGVQRSTRRKLANYGTSANCRRNQVDGQTRPRDLFLLFYVTRASSHFDDETSLFESSKIRLERSVTSIDSDTWKYGNGTMGICEKCSGKCRGLGSATLLTDV